MHALRGNRGSGNAWIISRPNRELFELTSPVHCQIQPGRLLKTRVMCVWSPKLSSTADQVCVSY